MELENEMDSKHKYVNWRIEEKQLGTCKARWKRKDYQWHFYNEHLQEEE